MITELRKITARAGGTILKSAIILTLISFGVKAMGMFFRVYLSNRMGAEGMGLYQLVMSVYSLFATFATSGFTVAVSRLCAEAFGENNVPEAKRTLRVSMGVSACFGAAAMIVLFSFSDLFAKYILCDIRTSLPLKILSASTVFMSVSGCYKGYFIASRKIYRGSLVSLSEQTVKTAVTMIIFATVLKGSTDVGELCTGLVIGLTAGEISSYIILFIIHNITERKEKRIKTGGRVKRTLKTVLSVTMPIAGSAYIVSALHTVESVLIPLQFTKYCADSSKALSDFGIVRGMVIPVLFFPFAFLSSVVSVMIPEISRLNGKAHQKERNAKISRIMKISFVFSICIGGMFYFFADGICSVLYNDRASVGPMRMLALVTPMMYIETISDGILKAIGEQLSTLRFSVYNSVLRISAILLVLQYTGLNGYLWLLVVSNAFSFFLCVLRLKKATDFDFNFISDVMLPVIFTVIAGKAAEWITSISSITSQSAGLILGALIFFVVYSAPAIMLSGKALKTAQ